jgi:hypothetical protein
MTKEQFIYLIKTQFEGGDGGSGGGKKWHFGDIERHVEMAFSDTVEQLYRQAIQYHDWNHIDPLTYTYRDVVAFYDSGRGEFKVPLPAELIMLPENGGLREVWIGKSQDKILTHQASGATSIYSEIDRYDGNGSSDYPYYLEGVNIWIKPPVGEKIEKVNMRLVRAFSDYGDADQVPTSFGKNGIIFDMVVQRMSRIYPGDDQNDSSSKKILSNG